RSVALRFQFGKVSTYAGLIILAAVASFPFYWMFVLATHDRSTIFSLPPPLMLGDALLENYQRLVAAIPFWRNAWNSLYTASVGTAAALFFCSLAGFGFAMYDFRFK